MRGRRRQHLYSGLTALALVVSGLLIGLPIGLHDDVAASNPVYEVPNIQVDDSPGTTLYPKIAVDANNRLHVVWEDRRAGNGDIYYSSSVDGGLTWSPSVRVDDAAAGVNSRLPDIAVNRSGPHVYVVYYDNRNGDNDIWVAVSPDSGVSWNPSVRVDDGAAVVSSTAAVVAVDDVGKVFVAWEDDRVAAFTPKIQTSVSTDLGATWGASLRVDTAPDSDFLQTPAVTATGDGLVNLAWRRRDTLYAIESARSSNSGANWTVSVVDVASGTNQVSYPDIQARSGGRVYATWVYTEMGGPAYQVMHSRSDDYGATWITPARVDDVGSQLSTNAETPTVSIVGGRPYVIWTDSRNGDRDIFVSASEDDGLTWGDGLDLTDSRIDDDGTGADQQRPASTSSGFGSYVVWHDMRNGILDIYFARLVISEVLLTEVQDSPNGFQRVEIANYGGKDVDFAGHTLLVDGTPYDISALGLVPAGDYRVVGDAGGDLNPPGFDLGDDGGVLELWNGPTLRDSIGYGQRGKVPDPLAGESTSRYYDGLAYVDGWARTPTPTFGVQNGGPGVVVAPALILNEVLYDATLVTDQYIELYYTGFATLNTTGYTLVSDSAYTILSGIALTAANRYAIFNYNDNSALFNNLDVGGDNLYLYDDGGWLLDMVGWNTTHAQDASVCRVPVGGGTFEGFDDASSIAAGWQFGCAPTLPLVAIGPPEVKYADLGEVVWFDLVVTNKQAASDTIGLSSVNGPNGWAVAICDAGQSCPITDTGVLGTEESVNITVRVTVPTLTQPSPVETINVTAQSSLAPLARDTVTLQLRLYPYVGVERTLVPSVVDLAGTGGQEIATVTLNATGRGFPFPRPIPQDVVLLIDSSGSMGPPINSDPMNERLTAAKLYIDLLSPPDRVSVLDFDEDCFWTGPNHHIDSPGHDGIPNYDDPKADVDTIDSIGATDLLCPIVEATTELTTRGNTSHTWVAILLTDGQDTDGNTVAQILGAADTAAANSITIFTIGLGPGADQSLLQSIADRTGGDFFAAPNPADLQDIYAQIHDALSNMSGADPFPGFNEPMMREVLPPYISVVPGSFAAPPWSIEQTPFPDSIVGGVMEWQVNRINLNESWVVSYDVTCSLPGTNPVAVSPPATPYARTAYVNWDGVLVLMPFPERLISCIAGVTPPLNVTAIWDGATGIGLTWDQPLNGTPNHYLIYKVAGNPRGFPDLTPAAAYDNVSAPATTWSDPAALSGPGESYYVMRSANANETDVSATSNTAGVFVGALNPGLTTISRPLEYYPWVDYSGAELDTVGEYRSAFFADAVYYMDANGRWQDVPGAGDPATPLEVGRGYLVESANAGTFVFAGLPGAMLVYDEYAFVGFNPTGDAQSVGASVSGDDVTLTFTQPAGMTPGVDYYEVWFATTRAGFFDGSAQLVGGTTVLAPSGPTVTTTHTGGILLASEVYYLIVPVDTLGRGSSTYSVGVWTRTFQGHETLGLPLRPGAALSVDWYADAIPNVLGIDFLITGYWVGHVPAMPAGVYDTDVLLGAGYQITVSPGSGRYSFVGW